MKSPSATLQSERNYFDFVIDGQSLAKLTRYDLVGVLCREWVSEEREKSVNYEAEIYGEHLKRLGPFEFDLENYKTKLIRGLDMLKAPL